MYEREYKIANDIAKKELLKILDKRFKEKYNEKDKHLLERCYKELELLYEKQDLFIIYILYSIKYNHDYIYKLYFKGTLNNLLMLYILGLNEIDPIKYGLPYELYNESEISIYTDCVYEFPILFMDYEGSLSDYPDEEFETIDFKIIFGYFEKCGVLEIDKEDDFHYLLVPTNNRNDELILRFSDNGELETAKDYREYDGKIKCIAIYSLLSYKDELKNTRLGKNMRYTLEPKTMSDYIKIMSLECGNSVWSKNQEALFLKHTIGINDFISNREDLLEYLLEHKLDRKEALIITTFVGEGLVFNDSNRSSKWNDYKAIMEKYKCEDWFINACSSIKYLSFRGKAVSEYIMLTTPIEMTNEEL